MKQCVDISPGGGKWRLTDGLWCETAISVDAPHPIGPAPCVAACGNQSDEDFDSTASSDNQTHSTKQNRNRFSVPNTGESEHLSGLDVIRKFRYNHPKNFILSHYNVNSIRYKFVEVREILDLELVDFFGISETKLSSNFMNEFNVPNYCKPYRQDRNDRGGGVMVFIKDNLPHRLLSEYSGCHEGIDFLSFELVLKSRKWHITYFYRPPSVNEGIFTKFLSQMCDVFIAKGDAYIATGDCNLNCLISTSLNSICDVYGLHICNLAQGPTCFKGDPPSLVDVILTNKPASFSGCFNTDLGISDFHTCLGISSKLYLPTECKRKIFYRSKKKNFCRIFCQRM